MKMKTVFGWICLLSVKCTFDFGRGFVYIYIYIYIFIYVSSILVNESGGHDHIRRIDTGIDVRHHTQIDEVQTVGVRHFLGQQP